MGRLPRPKLIEKEVRVTMAADRVLVNNRIRMEGPGRVRSVHVADATVGLRKGDTFISCTLRRANAAGGINDLNVFFAGYNYAGGRETQWMGEFPYLDGDGLNIYGWSATAVTVTVKARIELDSKLATEGALD